jgi:iron complex transport system substrate-binding protein
MGFAVAMFRVTDMGSLMHTLDRLGVLTGTRDRADRLIADWRLRLDRVLRVVSGREPVPMVFEIRYPNLLVAGGLGMTADIIRRAGGHNLVPQGGKFVRLSEETLIRMAPRAYVTQRGPMNPCPVPLEKRRHFQILPAVRQGRVLVVDQLDYVRPGPANIAAVEELAAFLHPVFSAAVKEETP